MPLDMMFSGITFAGTVESLRRLKRPSFHEPVTLDSELSKVRIIGIGRLILKAEWFFINNVRTPVSLLICVVTIIITSSLSGT